MSYYPGLYPGFYVPDPYQTTWVSQHYPEHHHPLEHTRHSISRALGNIAHDFTHSPWADHAMISPRSDIRESAATFYIDFEVPGLADEKKVTLKWLGDRTLLLRAAVGRGTTPEDRDPPQQPDENKAEGKGQATHDKKLEQEGTKASESAQSVYLTLGERRVGTVGRAFSFPVDVDHDKVTAHLHAGVLRLTVPKVPGGTKIDKHVTVQAGGNPEAMSKGVVAAV